MAASTPSSPSATTRWLRTLPALLLLVGAVLTWLAHREESQTLDALRQAQFQSQATEVVTALERRLQNNAALLRGVASLFASSDAVNVEEFRTYVQGLDLATSYPWIQGVGFAEWRPTSPALPDQGHSRIVYLEPLDWRNQRALGRDMYAETVRRHAMAQAVATGRPALSGRVVLFQETATDTQAGFLMYVPIYRKQTTRAPNASPWSGLLGWAYSPLRAGDVIATLHAPGNPLTQKHLNLEWFASAQPDREQLLLSTVTPQNTTTTTLRHAQTMAQYGVGWLVQLSPTPAGLATFKPPTKPNALLHGSVLTLLAASLAHAILRGRRRIAQALALSQDSNQQLLAQQNELRLAGTVMAASPMGIVVTDAQRRIVSVNPAFTRITGYRPDEVMGQTPRMLSVHPQPQPVHETLVNALQTTGRWEGELQNRRKDGAVYPEFLSICAVHNAQGQLVNYVGLFQDITERRQAEDRILQLAHHDYLTNLPNRALMVERATVELTQAKRYGRHPALLFIDLDRFKPVNDTYGHEAGDAVLIEIAHRLTALLRETDLVCRQGGDEFVVLLPDQPNTAQVLALAERVVQTIEAPYQVGPHQIELSASVGVATYPTHGDTVDRLIQSADEAMYQAKHLAKQRVCLATAP